MHFSDYQDATANTAVYPEAGKRTVPALVYVTLGLAGEAGEVPNKVKKILRDLDGKPNDLIIHSIAYELGDVLWYLARVAEELGYDLSEIAQMNLDKLADRKQRGVIGGSGDTR